MHAFIITGNTNEQRRTAVEKRLSAWGVKPVDIVEMSFTQDRIGIESVREFQKRLMLAPSQSPYTAGIIYHCDRLTEEAQNALLKLLEEPPPHAYIICETDVIHAILPTILSRCEITTLSSPQETNGSRDVAESLSILLHASKGERLTHIDTIVLDRQTTKQWIHDAIIITRELMRKDPNVQYTKLLRLLTVAAGELELYINPKRVMDQIFLNI
jgi:DNA polymerase III delta prime subunit